MSEANEPHPTASEIVAIATGELAPADQARIAAHVEQCERCTDIKTAVLEAASKYQASRPAATGQVSDARTQAERLPLSPEHERLLTMLASPASLKTLAGELQVSVARFRRQVREAREFICNHNPRLLQRSYRALEDSLGADDDGAASDGPEPSTIFLDAVDRAAGEEYLARRFGAVNVGIHRAVYSADDDAEWERVLQALLPERAAPTPMPAPPAGPGAGDEAQWSSPDGAMHALVKLGDGECHYRFTHPDTSLHGTEAQISVGGRLCTLSWTEDGEDTGVYAEVHLHERVERPMEIEISREAPAVGRGRRARGRR